MFDHFLFRPRIGVFKQYEPRPFSFPVNCDNFQEIESWPKISIITPSLNQGMYIEDTIISVLSQNYPGIIEYIVQDGGSTDNTNAVINKYLSDITNFESIRDNGQSHALNKGFSKASGEIMAFINSDDIYLKGAFRNAAWWFNHLPSIDVIYGHRLIINSNNEDIGKWILPPFNARVLQHLDYIPQETVFWRRSIWERIGGRINEEFQFAFDWDLFLRFTQAGAKIKRVPCFFSAFRYHEEQKTSACQKELSFETEVIKNQLGIRSNVFSNFWKKLYFLESIGYSFLDYLKIYI